MSITLAARRDKKTLIFRPTNDISVAGNLASKPLYWASDLVDLRKADNSFEHGSMNNFGLDLKVSVNADLPGNLAWGYPGALGAIMNILIGFPPSRADGTSRYVFEISILLAVERWG